MYYLIGFRALPVYENGQLVNVRDMMATCSVDGTPETFECIKMADCAIIEYFADLEEAGMTDDLEWLAVPVSAVSIDTVIGECGL